MRCTDVLSRLELPLCLVGGCQVIQIGGPERLGSSMGTESESSLIGLGLAVDLPGMRSETVAVQQLEARCRLSAQ
jgi:hypothetical protein